MTSLFDCGGLRKVFEGRRILVTGHTGFKGGWICLWLDKLGADIVGVALPPPDGPSLCGSLGVDQFVDHRVGDIRNGENFSNAVSAVDAELIIHMAAKAIVRESYSDPVDTYLTNVIGTANVLEAARKMPSLRAAIIVTSDKCYENTSSMWGYREQDPMGGSDPYSASKGCTELLTTSYRRSYFSRSDGPHLASVRAGNVFGGGDWAKDRLFPDIVRATLAGERTHIRNPDQVRPWQHVFDPLFGYLLLAARLLSDGGGFAEGWNFGPDLDGATNVRTLAEAVERSWVGGRPQFTYGNTENDPPEADLLRLDSTKSRLRLGWRPRLPLESAVDLTIDWYQRFSEGQDMRAVSEHQIEIYSGLVDQIPKLS